MRRAALFAKRTNGATQLRCYVASPSRCSPGILRTALDEDEADDDRENPHDQPPICQWMTWGPLMQRMSSRFSLRGTYT